MSVTQNDWTQTHSHHMVPPKAHERHTMFKDAFFGSDAQQALLRRSRALFDMVSGDRRFSYYGRTIGLLRPDRGNMDDLERLVAIQGASNFSHIPNADVDELQLTLKKRNLSLTAYDKWEGDDSALDAAERIIADTPLPPDLTLRRIDADAPREDLALFAQVSLDNGVLPLAGSVLRGVLKPGVGYVAVDRDGSAVSAAAAASFCHPSDPQLGQQCWWGSLATADHRRGERLALILGAWAIRDMHDRFGYASFMTGVQPGNAPSQAVCTKSGLSPRGHSIVTAVDASALPGGKMTK